jgi:hypothetical protein
MREFVTAVKAATEPVEQGEEFTIDSHPVRCFKPTEGQVAIYMAESGRHSTDNDRTAAVINFFMGLFEPDDQAYLANRLLDRDDAFGLGQISEILNAMMEDWSGRPTQPSTGSTPSRSKGGRRSTRPTQQSTLSASPSIAS